MARSTILSDFRDCETLSDKGGWVGFRRVSCAEVGYADVAAIEKQVTEEALGGFLTLELRLESTMLSKNTSNSCGG